MSQHYKKYSHYLKERFGVPVRRISVDAGFSCPNRDGKIGTTGCIYCDNPSFSYNSRSTTTRPSVREQIEHSIAASIHHFGTCTQKYVLYFQAYTNTYASPEKLKEIYDVIREYKDIVGLSIATRPDCVDDAVLDVIASYCNDYDVWIEYGVQSMHNSTLEFIQRGHRYEDFLDAFARTRARGIKICAHIILGLPNETDAMMMETAREMGRLAVDGIKIHPLYVVRSTPMEQLYRDGKYTPLTLDQYAQLAAQCVTCLHPDTVVQRFTAACPKELLVAPEWIGYKNKVVGRIEDQLKMIVGT